MKKSETDVKPDCIWKIESLDEDHLLVNDQLIDIVAIRYILETNSWSSHSPRGIVERLSIAARRLYRDPTLQGDRTFVWNYVFRQLSNLTSFNYNPKRHFPVPFKAFSHIPGKFPFYKLGWLAVTEPYVPSTHRKDENKIGICDGIWVGLSKVQTEEGK